MTSRSHIVHQLRAEISCDALFRGAAGVPPGRRPSPLAGPAHQPPAAEGLGSEGARGDAAEGASVASLTLDKGQKAREAVPGQPQADGAEGRRVMEINRGGVGGSWWVDQPAAQSVTGPGERG